jgi:hypothetical protein
MSRSILAAFLTLLAVGLAAGEHPRLLFAAADIPALRARVSQQPFQAMYQRLLADAETAVRGESDSADSATAGKYFSAYRASKCGFLYVLTGDDAWAQKAKTYTENVFRGAWANSSASGLALYMHNKHVAQAYDFCYDAPSWATFRATVSTKLKQNSDTIYSNGGSSQNTSIVSNWQGLRYSTAGLGYLATDDAYTAANLTGCWNKVKQYCDANMGTTASPGWNYEGLGYTYYPWGLGVGPFGIAYQRAVPASDLRTANPNARTTFWTAVAANALFRSIQYTQPDTALIGSHPDFTDDNNHTIGEGMYGLAFHYLPDDLKPGMAWMYDRMRGTNGDQTWDHDRAGTIYSFLYHPGTAVTAQNPMTIPAWRALFKDTTGNGHNLFRNRYQDADDIVAALNLRLRTGGGHWGPDGQSFRISGLGAPFAVGGGRYSSGNPYYRLQNTLYAVNPGTTSPTTVSSAVSSVVTTANTPRFAADGSGAIVSRAATTTLNVKNHTRRWLADFGAGSGASAVFVCADTSDDGRWWQYATVDGVCTVGISGQTFTVTGPGGSSLRATVVYPAGAALAQGTLGRGSEYFFNGVRHATNRWVNANSADGDFLVVMTLVPAGGTHPAVTSVAGTGVTDRTIAIGGLQVQVNGDDIRTVTTANQPPAVTATGADPAAPVLP